MQGCWCRYFFLAHLCWPRLLRSRTQNCLPVIRLAPAKRWYLHGAFAIPSLSMLVGILIISGGIVSAATIVRGFVGYFQVLVDVPGFLVMVVLVTGLGGLAAWGIVESVRAAAIITLLEIVG
ncbi:MAG: hypothetical protein V3S73_05555, partial [Gammaproteobacteria bacterium]